MIHTGRLRRWAGSALACLALLWPTLAAAATDGPPIRWDMESLARVVKPMRHDMKGRMPLVLWNFPLPRNDDLVKLRADGTLRKHIDTLAARGIVPTVEMGWEWTPAGAMAMAKTLQEAGPSTSSCRASTSSKARPTATAPPGAKAPTRPARTKTASGPASRLPIRS